MGTWYDKLVTHLERAPINLQLVGARNINRNTLHTFLSYIVKSGSKARYCFISLLKYLAASPKASQTMFVIGI